MTVAPRDRSPFPEAFDSTLPLAAQLATGQVTAQFVLPQTGQEYLPHRCAMCFETGTDPCTLHGDVVRTDHLVDVQHVPPLHHREVAGFAVPIDEVLDDLN